MNKTAKIIFGVFLISILAILLVLTPFATIWAINTLFATGIAYTFYTWLAVVVLNVTIISSFRLKGE